MHVRPLPAATTAELHCVAFSYDAVGATAGEFPTGFHVLRRSRVLSREVTVDAAAAALMGWSVQLRAGLRVATSSETARPGAVVVLGLGLGPARLSAPCRVVYVVDEPHRRGFAYGTLPGHPESGEERFVVEQHPDGRVVFTISAFSRPASALARVGGPVTRRLQNWMTDRYLRALDS